MPRANDTFHSAEAQAIMGKAPVWVVRWGITVLFAIFAGVLVGAYFIQYPDLVKAPVRITLSGSGDMVGSLEVAATDFRKIAPGQRINIKLDGWPYMEYGVLRGQVESISLVPAERGFPVEFALPDGLTTSFGKTIPPVRVLDGQGEIVTAEKRLIDRLLEPITSLFKTRQAPCFYGKNQLMPCPSPQE